MLDNWIAADRRVFAQKKDRIEGAINGVTGLINGVKEENKEDIFYMLMFCLCVPQSQAIKAEEAIEKLRKLDFYIKDLERGVILDVLYHLVRFHSTKCDRLIKAKKEFERTWIVLKKQYEVCSECKTNESEDGYMAALRSTRNLIIRNINGVGMKLSSHIMRNVGMPGLAILDVHILAGLHKRKLIPDPKPTLTRDSYLDMEKIMQDYAVKVGISIAELDFLLWSEKTGFVFK